MFIFYAPLMKVTGRGAVRMPRLLLTGGSLRPSVKIVGGAPLPPGENNIGDEITKLRLYRRTDVEEATSGCPLQSFG